MKEFILNRKNQKISVELTLVDNPTGLVFIMHGLSGNKEQAHIQAIKNAFTENYYSTVLFDTTNTFGESDGTYEDATVTNYYEDLEDLISWSKSQKWYVEPFALAGHSLGGYSVTLYAEKNPEEVSSLIPVSPLVSGRLSAEAHMEYEPVKFNLWKESGWREDVSSTRPDRVKKLPWSHMEDRLKHDLLPKVKNLTMPTLIIVGENDTSTPVKHVKILYDQVPQPKQFHLIKEAPHTFRSQPDLQELTITISCFIKGGATNSTGELFDLVNENNEATGKTITRKEAHQTGAWHRTVHIYLYRFNPEIQLLVHLRSKSKDLCPNMWDTRFGGHLKAGETVEDCVSNELKEEVGLTLDQSKLIAGDIYQSGEYPNREFSYQFYYHFTDDTSSLVFNDGEVQDVRWLTLTEIENEMKLSPDKWSGKRIFEKIQRDLLMYISKDN